MNQCMTNIEWCGRSLGNQVRVKIFSSTAAGVEKEMQNWLDSNRSKIARVVETHLSSHQRSAGSSGTGGGNAALVVFALVYELCEG